MGVQKSPNNRLTIERCFGTSEGASKAIVDTGLPASVMVALPRGWLALIGAAIDAGRLVYDGSGCRFASSALLSGGGRLRSLPQ
jgi:hypothetical protein